MRKADEIDRERAKLAPETILSALPDLVIYPEPQLSVVSLGKTCMYLNNPAEHTAVCGCKNPHAAADQVVGYVEELDESID